MTFDFGTLVILILTIFFFIMAVVTKEGLFNLLTIPFTIWLIVDLNEGLTTPTLPVMGLAAFVLVNAFLTVISYFRTEGE